MIRSAPLAFFLSFVVACAAGQDQVPYGSNSAAGSYVLVNGIKVYYEIYGKGEPLLLLHGNSQTIADWQHQIPEFAKHFKVIAPDSRGQGKSSDDNRELTYDLMADDMVALLDSLHIKNTHLLGWSDGGNTGIAMALRNPEKIKTLITVGANYKIDTTAIAPELIEELVESLKAESDPQQRRLIELMLKYPRLTPQDLGRIRTPTIVMAGEGDVILPGHTAALAAAIPNATMIIVKDAGHFIPYEKPDEFNQIIMTRLGVKAAPRMSGTVKDAKSKEAIPYVALYMKNSGHGTSTDLSGNFELETPVEKDTLIISAVGYETQKICSADIGPSRQFLLASRDYILKEVTIRSKPLTAASVIKQAIRNLEKNYPQEAYGLEMYVAMDWQYNQKDSVIHAEGVLQGYNKTGYSRRVHAYFILMNRFYFKMIAERKQNVKDTSWVLPYQSDIMYREPVRFSNNPINKGNIDHFDFRFENAGGQDSLFVISFRCKDPNYWNTAETYSTEYLGEIHVNSRDFAIVKYKATNIADRDLLVSRGKKTRFLPRNLQEQFEVNYTKVGNVYFPASIRSRVFTYQGNKRTPVSLFSSETTVYKLTLENPVAIDPPKNYKVPPFKNTRFDVAFWKNFVIPQPIGHP